MRLPAVLLALACFIAPAAAQTLNVGVRAGPVSLDPQASPLAAHVEAVRHVYEALVGTDDTQRLQPLLAESWRPLAEDVWEFRLRRGVRFHDGTEFTAEDVAFSVARVRAMPAASPAAAVVRRVQDVRVVDPYRVHVVTDGAAPGLPADLARLFIVSRRALEALPAAARGEALASGRVAVGTGPYRFEGWTPGTELRFQRFAGYWGGAEPWAAVVRREMPDDAERLAALRAGRIDVMARPPAAERPALERDGAIALVRREGMDVLVLELDQRERAAGVAAADGAPLGANPLRDGRVREAIDLAIDRRALVQGPMDGVGEPASQLVPPGVFGFNPTLDPVRGNAVDARRLLADAGYPNGFRLELAFPSDREPARSVGAALPNRLADVGITVVARPMPAEALAAARLAGGLTAVLWAHRPVGGDALGLYAAVLHGREPDRRLGLQNWWAAGATPSIDRVIDGARFEPDEARRERLLRQAADWVARERPILPLAVMGTLVALRRDRVELRHARSGEELLATEMRPAP